MKSKLIHRKLHCSLVALKQSETGDSRNHLFVVRAFSFCCANLHRKSEFLKARVCQNPLVRCLVRLARQWFSLRCKHSYLNWKLHLSSFTSTFHFSSSLSLSELGTLQKLCHWPTEWSVWTRRRPFVWPVWPILCRKTKKRSTQSAAKAVSCKVSFNGTYEDILWPPPIQTFCIYYYIYILFFIVVIDIYIYIDIVVKSRCMCVLNCSWWPRWSPTSDFSVSRSSRALLPQAKRYASDASLCSTWITCIAWNVGRANLQ